MTPSQIKANQALCTHRFSADDIEKHQAFAKCKKGCGFEFGQSNLYREVLDDKLKDQKKL